MNHLKKTETPSSNTHQLSTLDDFIHNIPAAGEKNMSQSRSLHFWALHPISEPENESNSREEHRQRDTPTTEECDALIAFMDPLTDSQPKNKKSKREQYNEDVLAALDSGVLTQISPPLSWESSLSSGTRTPQESQIPPHSGIMKSNSTASDTGAAEKDQTLSDLERAENEILSVWLRGSLSLEKRCELVNSLQAILAKQGDIVATTSAQLKSHSL